MKQAHDRLWTHFFTAIASDDEARSWLVWINGTHLVQSHVHGDKTHEPRSKKLTIDCELTLFEPCACSDGFYDAHDEQHDEAAHNWLRTHWPWWSKLTIVCELLLYRAMCKATELVKLMYNMTKQARDWLWTHFIRAMRTATELISDSEASSSLVVKSFSWSHLHGDRGLCWSAHRKWWSKLVICITN